MSLPITNPNALGSFLPFLTNFLPFGGKRNPFPNRYPVSNVPLATRGAGLLNQRRRFGKRQNLVKGRRGMEINRAEGGFKNLNSGGKRILRNIDIFWDFSLNSENKYIVDDSTAKELFIFLENSQEHRNWLSVSYKYKPLGVNVSIDYNTPVPVQTGLSKLVLSIKTPLLEGDFPKYNASSMQLNMSRMGVKNFNFRFNRGNMKPEDLGPFKVTEGLPSVKLMLDSQFQNYNPDGGRLRLGVMKVSFVVAYWLIDKNTNLSQNLRLLTSKSDSSQLQVCSSVAGYQVVSECKQAEDLKEIKNLSFDVKSEDVKVEDPVPDHEQCNEPQRVLNISNINDYERGGTSENVLIYSPNPPPEEWGLAAQINNGFRAGIPGSSSNFKYTRGF